MKAVYGEFDSYDAIKCAEYALTHLYNARDLLSKAKGWGWADIFGGGLITTIVKRNRMGDAQSELVEARRHINRLLSMTNSTEKIGNFMTDDGPFMQFTDYMFDNLITDIVVQQRIESIRQEVDETIYKIEAIKQRLYEI
ncbi:MAG: hypothetical protein IJI05_00900 [Erysipelotrichaceae bacterium]|nr:hypothetical protein [Erysipelotrichaceae bacterium]